MKIPKEHKIRKSEQRRIDRYCGNIIGLHVGNKPWYKIIDYAKFGGVSYLLGLAEDKSLAIYQLIKVGEAIKLTPKKLLENRLNFCNKELWKEQSLIQMDDNGTLLSSDTTL